MRGRGRVRCGSRCHLVRQALALEHGGDALAPPLLAPVGVEGGDDQREAAQLEPRLRVVERGVLLERRVPLHLVRIRVRLRVRVRVRFRVRVRVRLRLRVT